MLQIISGKFFREGSERFSHDTKGILYSNYSYFQSIDTCIAKLEPVLTSYQGVTPYVISYVNQIEYEELRPGTVVRVGDTEIVQQFQLLCIFGLRGFFDIEKSHVEINCRERPKNSGDRYIPSKFVSRFFDTEIRGTIEEAESFAKFVDKVIGLPRKTYKAVIRFLENFSDALQVLTYNFDLAYSMLVYALESLSQNFDLFEPTWEDYDQNVRVKLDDCFSKIDKPLAEEIRNILLKSSHIKLQKRFVSFIYSHISESFFTSEAAGINTALRKSELERVLQNAYSIRSKYSHQLLPIQEHLKDAILSQGDVFHWLNEPLLTFNGLVRLTYHVIHNFIQNQPYLEKEEYNWYSELPGVISMRLAPEYWIWQTNFDSSQASARLSGFLSHFVTSIISEEPIVNLNDLMQIYEKEINHAQEKHKLSMLALYYIYNNIIHEDIRRPNYQELIKRYQSLLNNCCIESFLTSLIEGRDWRWNIEECVSCYFKYHKSRFSEKSLELPLVFELSILLEIANSYLREGNKLKYQEWMKNACLEAAGLQQLQAFIDAAATASTELKLHDLIGFMKRMQSSEIPH